MPYSIEINATSAAPPEVLFEHLAVAEAWGVWARFPVKPVRERAGDPVPDGEGAIRRIWPAREQVVAYDPPGHYSYIALSGLPIKDYRADVTFTARPDGGTALRWQGRFEPRIPGTGPLFRLFLTRMLGGFARGVAEHCERCEPGCPAHR
ncbi:SRPBCC family protein [Actinomadura scrupuli]|uniref:SRPBCC family protein n=1 Tax=Actinomadura scrupuli TaxID=559629 RepID=UPI003D9645E7